MCVVAAYHQDFELMASTVDAISLVALEVVCIKGLSRDQSHTQVFVAYKSH